jgi:hypothetical protein
MVRYINAGPDARLSFVSGSRFAIYIVISIPNRKSIARGVSHFIRASYVYCIVVTA